MLQTTAVGTFSIVKPPLGKAFSLAQRAEVEGGIITMAADDDC
jgi:hypothetical protein